MNAIHCLTCDQIVRHDERRLQGCYCDPDAPSWVAIDKDGRVVASASSRWERRDA